MRSAYDWRPLLLASLFLVACSAVPVLPLSGDDTAAAGPTADESAVGLTGDDTAAAARKVSDDSGAAVVAVRLVIKLRMVVEGREMDESERTDEIRATVIDPSGLAVCSLSEVDPSRQMDFMMEEDPDYRFEAEVVDVKILQPGGKEIPAKVVLRDRDLDLAFIRPVEAPSELMAAIDLTKRAEPQVLDQLVVLGRLGAVGNRVPSVALDRVQAIVEKPRTFYITGMETWMTGLGCPVFTLDGAAVGVLVVRAVPSVSSGDAGPYGDAMPVVLPAADILEAAEQAP